MERFRAHEKEFKKKQFSKKALLSSSGRRSARDEGSDGSDMDSDYGDDYGEDYDQEDPEEEDKEDMLIKDKEWLVDYLMNIKIKIQALETDLEKPKLKGVQKKQKEKQLASIVKIKDKVEDLNNQMYVDLVDGGTIRNLKGILEDLLNSGDEEQKN